MEEYLMKMFNCSCFYVNHSLKYFLVPKYFLLINGKCALKCHNIFLQNNDHYCMKTLLLLSFLTTFQQKQLKYRVNNDDNNLTQYNTQMKKRNLKIYTMFFSVQEFQ